LNQGYGWAGNINLSFIFDQLFSVEWGSGYPAHRKEPQREGRLMLEQVSLSTHRNFTEIMEALPDAVTRPSLAFLRSAAGIDLDSIKDTALRGACLKRSEK
jgi:hypothetical protein